MRVLYLYRCSNKWSYNHWINLDFIIDFSNIRGVELKTYGPNMHKKMKDKNLIQYNNNLTMRKIQTIWPFDVILIGHRNRMFFTTKEKKSWLPIDFKNINVPKIMLEPDYHNYKKRNAPLNWVKVNNINAILHRHKCNLIRANGDFPNINHIWLPMSVDPNIFKPNNRKKRINKICFVGTISNKKYYQYRKRASEILQNEGLLDNKGKQFEDKYIKCLQSYVCHLSGSSIFNIDPGKIFEIISSGSVLLTDECFSGMKDLFPDNCYITYKRDYSDVISKAKMILNNSRLRKKINKKARKHLLKNHTHKHRAKSLYNVLKKYNKQSVKVNKDKTSSKLDIVYHVGNLDKGAIIRMKKSYNSIKENKNYNICISEIGRKSNKKIFDSFISKYRYYYEKADNFNASIAKNNAFKYLITSNVFTFLDIDLLVPKNFVSEVLNYYEKIKKPFVLSYVRLPKIKYNTYNSIKNYLKNKDYKIRYGLGMSGIIVCDKITYKDLNGFDEEYVGWGARDSDFNLRASLMNKIKIAKHIVLYHMFHDRTWMKNKLKMDNVKKYSSNKNHIRYKKREKLYKGKKIELNQIKGLEDLRVITSNLKKIIKFLLANGIEVCFLEDTCKEWVLNNTLSKKIIIGVKNKQKVLPFIKNIPNIELKQMPKKTKELSFNGYKIKVPFPVVKYLKHLYGDNITKKINRKQ